IMPKDSQAWGGQGLSGWPRALSPWPLIGPPVTVAEEAAAPPTPTVTLAADGAACTAVGIATAAVARLITATSDARPLAEPDDRRTTARSAIDPSSRFRRSGRDHRRPGSVE